MKHITIILAILILNNCGQNEKRISDNLDSSTQEFTQSSKELTNGESNSGKWFESSKLDTLLIFSDNLQLNLKHADSISINEYFLDVEIIDSLTKSYSNWHKRALEIEKYMFKAFGSFAKRDKNGLYVELENGEWKHLNIDSAADEADNTFEYYFKDWGFYSIRVQWGEGSGYKLVNRIDGSETKLYGRPYFSPNGQLVISVNADIEAGYSENGFQLFKNEKGRLKHLGNYTPNGWGPYSAKWINNNKIVLKNQTIEVKDDAMNYIDFYTEINIKNGD